MFIAYTGAQYQFSESDYATEEGVNSVVRVVVQQISASLVEIHLRLTPLTYAQYAQRASQDGQTSHPLNICLVADLMRLNVSEYNEFNSYYNDNFYGYTSLLF